MKNTLKQRQTEYAVQLTLILIYLRGGGGTINRNQTHRSTMLQRESIRSTYA